MRILLVIHGYPPYYMGGSEVYTELLAIELHRQGHEVAIFTRYENIFDPPFHRLKATTYNGKISLFAINKPWRSERYSWKEIDNYFAEVLMDFKPDVVHVGHLNHLSLGIVTEAKYKVLPVVHTLHDYWLICPKGQFMQQITYPEGVSFRVCTGQEDRKCALFCYAASFSGSPDMVTEDIDHWERWVRSRKKAINQIIEYSSYLICPSRTLLDIFQNYFPQQAEKFVFLPYGFDKGRIRTSKPRTDQLFTFGYIGRLHPSKGIDLLLKAFALVKGEAQLKIWGRAEGTVYPALLKILESLPSETKSRVQFLQECDNKSIGDCLSQIDILVVPSRWLENSPLVIHEALQARVPVLTANYGGMKELIREGENGLLFEIGDVDSLAQKMQHAYDNRAKLNILGRRGYLYTPDGEVPSIEDHVQQIVELYHKAVETTRHRNWGPIRITFDTNPDDCNLSCIMCEEHSPYSPFRLLRKEKRLSHRRMDIQLVRKVLTELKDSRLVEVIPSTMGEPTLYKHFEEIVELCKEFGLKLNVTTNGTFPNQGPEKWARMIVPITQDVKFSINGANGNTDRSIMIHRDFDKFIDNVRKFIEIREEHYYAQGNYCRVTFQVTLMTLNIEELPQLVLLANDLGVDRIKAHHLWVHFPELRSLSIRGNPQATEKYNQIVQEIHVLKDKLNQSRKRPIVLENLYPIEPSTEILAPPNSICPFLGKEAWIAYDGRFNPCCAPDYERVKLGYFGNLNNSSFRTIWEGDAYQNLLKDHESFEVCKKCNVRKIS